MTFTEEQIDNVGALLLTTSRPLKERFRALFTLKNVGGEKAIDWMGKAFSDESALLKHEVAYCLGQMQDKRAIPVLTSVLEDASREAIVRHEAGEALGAIGGKDLLPLLEKYCSDPVPEVSDTCKLAVDRIRWTLKENQSDSNNPYHSVDPAPPSSEKDVTKLTEMLLNEDLPLFERYRAMFSLRNDGSPESITALAKGLKCQNALFRHEIAFVLGQVQSDIVKDQLMEALRNDTENEMVRHECAEALGSIASMDINEELKKYRDQSNPAVVRESCDIALDFADYNNSSEFQYANALSSH